MRAYVNSSTSIYVIWDEISVMGSSELIIAYEVTYLPLQTFHGAIGENSINVSGSDQSLFLVDLQEYVNYSITVKGYSTVGPGPANSPLILLTLQNGR